MPFAAGGQPSERFARLRTPQASSAVPAAIGQHRGRPDRVFVSV